jgi:cytochrome P450
MAQGSDWRRQRTTFGKRLMTDDTVRRLVRPASHVTDDVIERLRNVRDEEGDLAMTRSLTKVIRNWTFELSGLLLFETRLGCLDLVVPQRTLTFVSSIDEMLDSSLPLIVGERLHARLNTGYWQRHKAAWDQLTSIAKELVDERIAAVELQQENGDSSAAEGVYLTFLLKEKVCIEDIYSNVMDLLIAGTHTTAITYCFIVYLLANNPDVQRRLFDEIIDATTGCPDVTSDVIDRLVYLKCVIKEGLRLFPTVTMNCRILENDAVLGGYLIPKQTLILMNHYAVSHDPDVFPDADSFRPERWLRSAENELPSQHQTQKLDCRQDQHRQHHQQQHHPFASIPFGYGSRSCVGRRIAMMELAMILVKTLQNFSIEAYPGMDFRPTLKTLLTTGDRVPVRFVDRDRSLSV